MRGGRRRPPVNAAPGQKDAIHRDAVRQVRRQQQDERRGDDEDTGAWVAAEQAGHPAAIVTSRKPGAPATAMPPAGFPASPGGRRTWTLRRSPTWPGTATRADNP